jgi:N-acetylglucosamine-6-phosphate deacetylase
VLIEGTTISAIVAAPDARLRDAHVHDLHGRMLVPGFIDCQVNGGGDVLFNAAPTVETIRRIGAAHRRFGTTGFLPTLISDDLEVMRAAIDAVEQAIAAGVPGVLGIHLEGPFLAPARKGIHDAGKFVLPDARMLDVVTALRGGRTLLTLAPERCPPRLISELTARGVIVAAGHTAATHAETHAALNAGLRGFTHLFNAMSPLQSREPGVVGAALEDAASWCGVIVDGEHVHPATLRVALAAKPRGRVFLVTDAMPPVGGESTVFELYGSRIDCAGGVCRGPDGTLAGSALDMATAVRNTVTLLGVAAEEALRMASTYPAAFLNLAGTQGSIRAGARADLVELDDAFQVLGTWISGVTG